MTDKKSDDYKRGWFDGFQVGKNTCENMPSLSNFPNKCVVCGLDLDKVTGVVCTSKYCPTGLGTVYS
jgi:hypothetical protein